MANNTINNAISYWSLGVGGSYNPFGTFYAGYNNENNYQVGSIKFTNEKYAKTLYLTLEIYDKLEYVLNTPLYITWNDLSADVNYINRYSNDDADVKAQFSFSSFTEVKTIELNDIPAGTHYLYIWGNKNDNISRLRFSFPTISYNVYTLVPSAPEIVNNVNYAKLNDNYTLQWISSIGQDGAIIDKYFIEFSSDNFNTISKTLIIDNNLTKVTFLLDDNFINGLSIGQEINWRIYAKDNHGLISNNDSSSFKINTPPNAPVLSETSIILPSVGGNKKVIVTAGSDINGQICKVGYNDNENLPTVFYESPYELNLNKAGTYYFWTYDGIEASAAASTCEVNLNTKPIITSKSYNITDSHNLIGTITGLITEGKIATSAVIYTKHALISSGIKNAAAEVLESGFTITCENNKAIINIDLSGKNFEDYSFYSIGIKIKDEYEYSDIVWFDNIIQIKGDFPLEIDNPTISNTDNVPSLYSTYYKKGTINISWTPPITSGDIDLYYNFLYSTDGGGQWNNCIWQYNNVECKGRTKIINTNPINTLATIAAGGTKLLIKVEVYNKLENETKALSSKSNSLTYVPMISWPSNSPFELAISGTFDDKRNVVRPNYFGIESTDTAFILRIPLPNSVCSMEGNNQSLIFSYYIKRGENTSTVKTVAVTAEEQTYKQISISYKDLFDLNIYKWCESETSNLVGPYTDFIVPVSFEDPFGQRVESNLLNFTIDFREKPLALGTVLLGRDGVYDKYGTIDSALAIVANSNENTVFFPISNTDLSDKVILDGENMIICFNPSDAKSYSAQNFSKYYIDIYKNNTLLTTYIKDKADYIIGSKYGQSDSMISLVINTKNLFNDLSEYYVKVRIEDSLIYNSNISEPSTASNLLYGCIRAVPTLELSTLNYSQKDNDINVINIDYNKNIAISWINNFFTYNPFLRKIEYTDNVYPPPNQPIGDEGTLEEVKLCNFSLQIRFEDGDWIESPIYSFYSLDYTNNTDTTSSIDINSNRFYVRAKLEYYTGLGYDNGFYNVINTVYSTPQLLIGKIPTISHRKNKVGINCAPTNNEVFTIQSLKDNYNVVFRGNDLTDISQLHKLSINLGQGTISGIDFLLDWSLIPEDWFVNENEIKNIDIDSYTLLNS